MRSVQGPAARFLVT